jgi:hypothetical protein
MKHEWEFIRYSDILKNYIYKCKRCGEEGFSNTATKTIYTLGECSIKSTRGTH